MDKGAQVGPVVYEVFIQRDHDSSHGHVGSVLTTEPDMALLLAKENFLRRDPAVSIWVVRRADVHATPAETPAFFARETDRSYRVLSGYRQNNERWRKYRQRMMDLQELVRD